MKYQVNDQVMHWTYGRGEIISIEEKTLSGDTREYYVLQTNDLTLWVPADEIGESSLRPPLEEEDFNALLKTLKKPASVLPDQPYPRQNELLERMRNRSMNELCAVIRDLVARENLHKLNRSDQDILNRATSLLLDEWVLSLGTPREEAERKLIKILHPSHSS